MGIQILEIENTVDLERAFPIVKQLRPHLTWEQFGAIFKQARSNENFHLLAMFDGSECVAVMGYRILHDFVHGRHLYVDDLVVASSRRSQGLGAELLREAETIAKVQDCAMLRLSTGIENERGKRFYDAMGWQVRAVVYKKPVTMTI